MLLSVLTTVKPLANQEMTVIIAKHHLGGSEMNFFSIIEIKRVRLQKGMNSFSAGVCCSDVINYAYTS
jgi:hypothetical protein